METMENMDEAMFNEIAGGADYPLDMYVRVVGERNGTDYGLLRVSSKWHAMAVTFSVIELPSMGPQFHAK